MKIDGVWLPEEPGDVLFDPHGFEAFMHFSGSGPAQ